MKSRRLIVAFFVVVVVGMLPSLGGGLSVGATISAPQGPVGSLAIFVPRPIEPVEIERWQAALLLSSGDREALAPAIEAYSKTVAAIAREQMPALEELGRRGSAVNRPDHPDHVEVIGAFVRSEEAIVLALQAAETRLVESFRAVVREDGTKRSLEELVARREHLFAMEALPDPIDRRVRHAPLPVIESDCPELSNEPAIAELRLAYLLEVNPVLHAARRAMARFRQEDPAILVAYLTGVDPKGHLRSGESMEQRRSRVAHEAVRLEERVGDLNEAFVNAVVQRVDPTLSNCAREAWLRRCFPEVHPDPHCVLWAFDIALQAEIDESTRTSVRAQRQRAAESTERINREWRDRLVAFDSATRLAFDEDMRREHQEQIEALKWRRAGINALAGDDLMALVPPSVAEVIRRSRPPSRTRPSRGGG